MARHQIEANHSRPPVQPPLTELIALRQELYHGMSVKDFGKLVGASRLHVTAIEQGRRRPSLELALRWLELLAPKARLEMFGGLPTIEKRVHALRKLQKVSPQFFKQVA